VGLESGSLEAYCFDEVISYFGNYVTGVLQKIEGKDSGQIEAKQKLALKKLLAEDDEPEVYADPASFIT